MRQHAAGLLGTLITLLVLSAQITFSLDCASGELSPQKTSSGRRSTRKPGKSARKPRIDYSRFSHMTEKHKLECNGCHKFPSGNWKEARKGEEPFPDITEFPEHQSCLSCHRTQFFARERPAPVICSNCHVAVTPRNTVRYPFPSLGEPFLSSEKGREFVSDFRVFFPHDKHVDVVGRLLSHPPDSQLFSFVNAAIKPNGSRKTREDQPKSCPICHETYQPQGKSTGEFVTSPPKDLPEDAFWLKKGAFKTTPITHAACSACHNDEAGIAPLPASCASCHRLLTAPAGPRDFDPKLAQSMAITDWRLLRQWSKRSAGRYRHESDAHAGMSCTDCHNPTAVNERSGTLVSVKACGGSGTGCHVESNTDGILNYEIAEKKSKPGFQCTKCHIILGKQPVPGDHLEAIKVASK